MSYERKIKEHFIPWFREKTQEEIYEINNDERIKEIIVMNKGKGFPVEFICHDNVKNKDILSSLTINPRIVCCNIIDFDTKGCKISLNNTGYGQKLHDLLHNNMYEVKICLCKVGERIASFYFHVNKVEG